MAEASRVIDKMNQNYDIQGKLKSVSSSASSMVDRAQTNFSSLRDRSRDVFNRARGNMTTNNWIALGIGATAVVGLAVFFSVRSRRSTSESQSYTE